MNIMVLAEDAYTILGVVDAFESFIWTDRYNKYGDFELYTLASEETLTLFKKDRYVVFDESDHAMIIEKIKIETNSETGNHLTISGRSLESILERRVVWNQTLLEGNMQLAIARLLLENIIMPTDTRRTIPNFDMLLSSDERITSLSLKAQFTGDSLYDAISAICQGFGVGYKITLNDGVFIFSLYKGEDRTYVQTTNDIVVFSPGFDNLIDSNYQFDSSGYRNCALILGEGEGAERTRATVGEDIAGIGRRELYVDARDLSTTTDDPESPVDPEDYILQLQQRGEEKLLECEEQTYFDGSIDVITSFKPGVDFFMGDIVHIENEYGLNNNCRITELIHSYSIGSDGIKFYPTFEAVDNYTYFVPVNSSALATAEGKLLTVVR